MSGSLSRTGGSPRTRPFVSSWAAQHDTGGRVSDYDIKLDDKYGQSTLIDLAHEAAAHEPWFNQTLTTVNDSVVRLGVLQGEFHWHKHDHEDEFFLVLEGELVIEIEGG